jgi:minor histocompatibility antigen H13
MLAVATSDAVTGPTRLLFPRVPGGGGEAPDFPFSLLGLGDIALPGLLAALALRYDASRRCVGRGGGRVRLVGGSDCGYFLPVSKARLNVSPSTPLPACPRPRSTDMRARATAAAAAIADVLSSMDPASSGRQMADAAATAALSAYDEVADREDAQRARSQGGGGGTDSSSGSSSGADGAGGAAGGGGGEPERIPVSDALLVQRPTFSALVVAYCVGLVAAFIANSVTNLGQPALLYIVPSMLGALLLTGWSRGELGRLWLFTDVASWRPKPPLAPEAGPQ